MSAPSVQCGFLKSDVLVQDVPISMLHLGRAKCCYSKHSIIKTLPSPLLLERAEAERISKRYGINIRLRCPVLISQNDLMDHHERMNVGRKLREQAQ